MLMYADTSHTIFEKARIRIVQYFYFVITLPCDVKKFYTSTAVATVLMLSLRFAHFLQYLDSINVGMFHTSQTHSNEGFLSCYLLQ